MLSAAGDNNFIALFICKANRVTHQITPCTCRGTYKNSIFLSFFHLRNGKYLRVCNGVAVCIKIFLIERNELMKNMFVGNQPHAACIRPILVSNKTLAG